MTRNEALEKINKCISLATNAAAADGEKQNAWAMAEKLASKYGFKIVKREASKATDINFYNRTKKEEPKPAEYTVYKVSRFDAHIVSRILCKLGYDYVMVAGGFMMTNDQDFNFEAFKELYKLLLKQYDMDLNSFKLNYYGWNRSWSKVFKKCWTLGVGFGFAGEECEICINAFDIAGYRAGVKYSYYSKLIRKEAV